MSNNTPKPHKINDKGQITRKNKKLVDHTSIKIRRKRQKLAFLNPKSRSAKTAELLF